MDPEGNIRRVTTDEPLREDEVLLTVYEAEELTRLRIEDRVAELDRMRERPDTLCGVCWHPLLNHGGSDADSRCYVWGMFGRNKKGQRCMCPGEKPPAERLREVGR